MGLFSKPKRKIFDVLDIQINSDLISRLAEKEKGERFTDYSVAISDNFQLFDVAVFKVFSHDKNLSPDNSFNLILLNTTQTITIKKNIEMVNTLSSVYGNDRRGYSKWTDVDTTRVQTYWEGREWIINKDGKSIREFGDGCSQINLFFHLEEGLDFSILGANKLI